MAQQNARDTKKLVKSFTQDVAKSLQRDLPTLLLASETGEGIENDDGFQCDTVDKGYVLRPIGFRKRAGIAGFFLGGYEPVFRASVEITVRYRPDQDTDIRVYDENLTDSLKRIVPELAQQKGLSHLRLYRGDSHKAESLS